MKFIIKINGTPYEIETEKKGKDIFFILKGQKYNAQILESAPGLYSILMEDGRQREILANRISEGSFNFYINAKEYPANIMDFLSLEKEKFKREDKKKGGWNLKAQIPGKIVKILKNEGDFVKKDEGILIMEAMKMQNELKAPEEGRIKKIFVKEREAVEGGAVLLEAE